MITTTSTSTGATDMRSAPRAPSQGPAPAPSSRLDLRESGKVMGWIDGMAIGFRGFADEHEAAHAAWVAYRTMARRFAREGLRRPIPVDTEPLALVRNDDVELILAAGRPIAALVRPGADNPSGHDSHGFEIQMPMPADDLTTRSTAYLVYRTLRRSGIRWAMWTATPHATTADAADVADVADAADASPVHAEALAEEHDATTASGFLGTLLVIVAMIIIVILPTITTSSVVPLLGGSAGLVALAALASLVYHVAADIRDSLRDGVPRDSDELATATPNG